MRNVRATTDRHERHQIRVMTLCDNILQGQQEQRGGEEHGGLKEWLGRRISPGYRKEEKNKTEKKKRLET